MSAAIWSTHPHGKLLLTGEYAVLDGALALALPVRYGQRLEVFEGGNSGVLRWNSLDLHGAGWFEAEFTLPALAIHSASNEHTAAVLQQILLACRRQQAAFLAEDAGLDVRIQADFPRNWGLGTSSTLIAALAQWAGADPYRVLDETLGGSGYDIACAYAGGPLLYQRRAGRAPLVEPVLFRPAFAGQMFFVFLGQKQNSREGIRRYRDSRQQGNAEWLDAVSSLTRQCLAARELSEFAGILLEHEQLVARALQLPRAQDLFFPGFPGLIKSLGAWGGDFVLAAAFEPPDSAVAYFQEQGFSTWVPFSDMILSG